MPINICFDFIMFQTHKIKIMFPVKSVTLSFMWSIQSPDKRKKWLDSYNLTLLQAEK